MTKEELAKLLDGRQYGEEITIGEEKSAKASGLIVVFGYSDDVIEFRGVFRDEAYRCAGGDVFVTAKEVLEKHDLCGCKYCGFAAAQAKALKITAVWNPKLPVCEWKYRTAIPHATFRIWDGADLYCVGIVMSTEDFPK